VFFLGNTVVSNSIIDSIFKQNEFDRGISDIIEIYVNSGYPFAQIGIESISLIGDKPRYSVLIIENGFYKMNIFKSRGTLSDGFINRIVRLNNKPFSKNAIEASLMKLNRFEFVDISKIKDCIPTVLNDSEVVVECFLDQIRSSYITGIITTDFDTLKIAGFLDLSLVNVFNDGAEYTMYFSKITSNVSELTVKAQSPYIFSTPIGASGNIEYSVTDTLSAKFSAGVNLFTYIYDLTVTMGGGREWAYILGDMDSNDIYYFIYSSAEHIISKKGKAFFSIKRSFGRTEFSRLNFSVSAPINIGNFLIKPRLSSTYLDTDKYLSYMLLPFGGTNTIRGYPEHFIYASDYLQGNISIGYIFADNFSVGAFTDKGYYRSANENIFSNSLFSYGIFTALNAGQMEIEIDYALKSSSSFYDGRIHISTKYLF